MSRQAPGGRPRCDVHSLHECTHSMRFHNFPMFFSQFLYISQLLCFSYVNPSQTFAGLPVSTKRNAIFAGQRVGRGGKGLSPGTRLCPLRAPMLGVPCALCQGRPARFHTRPVGMQPRGIFVGHFSLHIGSNPSNAARSAGFWGCSHHRPPDLSGLAVVD